MKASHEELDKVIQDTICEHPGRTVSQTVDAVLKKIPSKEKLSPRIVRRRLKKLYEKDHLFYKRSEIVLYPSAKALEILEKQGDDGSGPAEED